MSRNFFGRSFTGLQVTFDTPAPRTWILAEKIKENANQLTHDLFISGIGASYAWATFNCSNHDDPAQQAQMQVYMQIPSEGTEFEPSRSRAEQATDKLSLRARTEWECRRRLTAAGNENTPTLLNVKKDAQDDNGLVPGGYILYLVSTRVPGVCLGSIIEGRPRTYFFWSMSAEDRERVRQKFKAAYMPMRRSRVSLSFPTLNDLTWDAEAGKIYICNFDECDIEKPPLRWRNNIWGFWGLARPPADDLRWTENDYNDRDLVAAGWTL